MTSAQKAATECSLYSFLWVASSEIWMTDWGWTPSPVGQVGNQPLEQQISTTSFLDYPMIESRNKANQNQAT